MSSDVNGTSIAIVNGTVVAIQGNTVKAQSLGSNQDGYVLTWVDGNDDWEATPLPGSLPPDGVAGGDLDGYYPAPSVRAIQGNAIESGTLGANQDGYVLTWVNSADQWEPRPATMYGSMYINGNTTPTNISNGSYNLINSGYVSNTSYETTLSTSNGTITVNQTGVVMLQFTTTWGTASIAGAGYYFYNLAFFKNGSIVNNGVHQVYTPGEYNNIPQCTTIQTMVAANAGDVFDVYMQPIGGTGTSSAYYPVIYLASFNVFAL
jgi:hypothetical protein